MILSSLQESNLKWKTRFVRELSVCLLLICLLKLCVKNGIVLASFVAFEVFVAFPMFYSSTVLSLLRDLRCSRS